MAEPTVMASTGARLPAHQDSPRSGARAVVCFAVAALLAACAPAGSPDAGDGQAAQPRFPSLSAIPGRPEGLPSEDELAERRRRLEADRDQALGRDDVAETPAAPVSEPLPELSETMEEIPVERTTSGPAEVSRAGVSVEVATVYFPGDSVDLDQQMIDELSRVAREQQAIGGTLRVVGHGGEAASEDLARRQLAQIGQTLMRMGVPPTRIGTERGEPGGDAVSDHGRAVIYLDY